MFNWRPRAGDRMTDRETRTAGPGAERAVYDSEHETVNRGGGASVPELRRVVVLKMAEYPSGDS
jgi:hypothetical protein